MRKPIGIVAIALVAIGAVWAWTLTQSGANARHKVAGAAMGGINILDLTTKAGVMPVQSFDAH